MDKTRVTSDGITVSKPEIVRGDTVFTVWEPNESNAREVVLAGPNASYYKYMQKIPAGYVAEGAIPAYQYKPVIGYDPEVLNRYRQYIIEGEKANDYKSVLGHILDAIRGLKQGGYLQKYASGGKSQNQILSQVMQIIKKAANEIQRQSPGEGVSQLIQLMQDPNGSQVLQTIASQYPEAGQIISAAQEYASQLAKKGSKLLKKAGCGCGTTKKLMKSGGKLIEIEVDCNGLPIFAKKGTKLLKGQIGLDSNKLLNKEYRGYKSGSAGDAQYHFYLGDDGKWRKQTATNGQWDTNNIQEIPGNIWDNEEFKSWRSGRNDNGTMVGGIRDEDFFVQGFSFDPTTKQGKFADTQSAIAALGQQGYNEYNSGPAATWGSAVGTVSNSATGTTGAVTAQQAVDQLGHRGALRTAKDIYRAERRAARKGFNKQISANLGLANKMAWNQNKELRAQRKQNLKNIKNRYQQNVLNIGHTLLGSKNTTTPGTSQPITTQSSTQNPLTGQYDLTQTQKREGYLERFK